MRSLQKKSCRNQCLQCGNRLHQICFPLYHRSDEL
ncbi:hypothetical protein T12_12947 [Trichinella patagoniensis]|uniref:Uncharacterized protein n=1 Tax=Trichinella patagoniensis TaxID=990121 RepID=A0A0V0XPZ1_9BILA|nr:hypothetical protein T12_12947 [Trichinella patagoniensis]